MTRELEIELDESNSRVYRSKADQPKQGRIRWEAARYSLSWGTQEFLVPHVLVSDPSGAYGVTLEVFFATHRALVDRPDHYVKVVKVRAVCVNEAIILKTLVKGEIEMTALVPGGAYVVQNPDGEQYAMAAEEFHQRYELDE